MALSLFRQERGQRALPHPLARCTHGTDGVSQGLAGGRGEGLAWASGNGQHNTISGQAGGQPPAFPRCWLLQTAPRTAAVGGEGWLCWGGQEQPCGTQSTSGTFPRVRCPAAPNGPSDLPCCFSAFAFYLLASIPLVEMPSGVGRCGRSRQSEPSRPLLPTAGTYVETLSPVAAVPWEASGRIG